MLNNKLQWSSFGLLLVMLLGLTSCTNNEARSLTSDSSDTAISEDRYGGHPTGVVEGNQVGPKVGQIAPDFVINTVEGDVLSRSSFEGQSLILYFFATW